MATKIILPKLGQTMEEGTIVEWNKKEGDPVGRGDVLFQIESDKAVLEVESRAKGVLRRILVEKGIKVPVMTLVGIIAGEDEDISELLVQAEAGPGAGAAEEKAPAAAAVATAAPETEAPAAPAPVHREGERIFASPRARKLAREKGVDLAYVTGSGPEGRIVEKDVLSFLQLQPAATPMARRVAQEMGVALGQLSTTGERVTAAQVLGAATPAGVVVQASSAPAAGETVPMSTLRSIIAERMGTSAHTTASVTLTSVVDATEFVALRTKLKDALAGELGFSVSYNDLLAKVVAKCMIELPYMNARLEGNLIRYLTEINIGVAVDVERGLLVPVVRGVDKMGLVELARTARDVVTRAREGRSSPDELSGGSFTITNLGMFGIDMFTPIINLPECAILGVGRIRLEPTVVDGEIVARQRMWLSLTFDHRLVDGAPAARFLQKIVHYIENPYLLLA